MPRREDKPDKPKVTVGTTKKSTAAAQFMWLAKKLRHVCDGGELVTLDRLFSPSLTLPWKDVVWFDYSEGSFVLRGPEGQEAKVSGFMGGIRRFSELALEHVDSLSFTPLDRTFARKAAVCARMRSTGGMRNCCFNRSLVQYRPWRLPGLVHFAKGYLPSREGARVAIFEARRGGR